MYRHWTGVTPSALWFVGARQGDCDLLPVTLPSIDTHGPMLCDTYHDRDVIERGTDYWDHIPGGVTS